jgi:ring-1,2-phenylacetyl-CoA epoxidase subunit PaaD
VITQGQVMDALRRVEDPEVPVDIVALGLVRSVAIEGERVTVTLAPTYAACPGRAFILEQARTELAGLTAQAEVRWSAEPHWRRDLIQPDAIRKLRDFGVGPPEEGRRVPRCPYCGSGDTRLEREFGSAVCKSLCYCDACRSPFEAMRGAW